MLPIYSPETVIVVIRLVIQLLRRQFGFVQPNWVDMDVAALVGLEDFQILLVCLEVIQVVILPFHLTNKVFCLTRPLATETEPRALLEVDQHAWVYITVERTHNLLCWRIDVRYQVVVPQHLCQLCTIVVNWRCITHFPFP